MKMSKMSRPQPSSRNAWRCLGFDPGIAITGYGVIERRAGSTSCLAYGVIRTSQKMLLTERLKILHHEAMAIIAKYQPEIIGLETLIFAKNVKTGIVVGEARGVLLLAIASAKIELIELTPLQVKQALTSYGRAEKHQVQYMVKQVLKLKTIPRPDDAADALAVALAAEQMRGAGRQI